MTIFSPISALKDNALDSCYNFYSASGYIRNTNTLENENIQLLTFKTSLKRRFCHQCLQLGLRFVAAVAAVVAFAVHVGAISDATFGA